MPFLRPSSFILPSAEALADLLGAEGADAVEAEAEDEAVLVAQADVEGEVLRGDGAAVPGAAHGDDRADQGGRLARPRLEVEEEGGAAVEASVAVADEDGRTPLRALQRARLVARRVAELAERGRERDGARVVEGLEGFDGAQHGRAPPQAERYRQVAQAAADAERVDVGARVHEQFAVGGRGLAHARLDVQGREAARHAAVGEAGEGVDGVELVALSGDERAAEGRVEEILLPERDGEELVGLARQGRLAFPERRQRAAHARVLRKLRALLLAGLLLAAFFLPALLLAGFLLGALPDARTPLIPPGLFPRRGPALDGLGRAAEEEAVGDAVLDLVRVGGGVHLVEAYDAVEVRDAADLLVSQVRLDDVAEPEGAVAVVEVARERRGPHVEGELAVDARDVRREDEARQGVYGVGVEGAARGGGRREVPADEVQGQRDFGSDVEALDDGRRGGGVLDAVGEERRLILDRLLAAHAGDA